MKIDNADGKRTHWKCSCERKSNVERYEYVVEMLYIHVGVGYRYSPGFREYLVQPRPQTKVTETTRQGSSEAGRAAMEANSIRILGLDVSVGFMATHTHSNGKCLSTLLTFSVM